MEKKLSLAQHNMERNMLNITYKYRKTNTWVRDQNKLMDIMEIIKNRKWTWTGHISRITNYRRSAALTVWTPMGCKRNRGRQRKSRRDELQQYWGNASWYMEQETETFEGNMLRLSSCSGLILAEDDL